MDSERRVEPDVIDVDPATCRATELVQRLEAQCPEHVYRYPTASIPTSIDGMDRTFPDPVAGTARRLEETLLSHCETTVRQDTLTIPLIQSSSDCSDPERVEVASVEVAVVGRPFPLPLSKGDAEALYGALAPSVLGVRGRGTVVDATLRKSREVLIDRPGSEVPAGAPCDGDGDDDEVQGEAVVTATLPPQLADIKASFPNVAESLRRDLCPTATDIVIEPYKLVGYAAGDFFRTHVDTPDGEDHVATLVVHLPTCEDYGLEGPIEASVNVANHPGASQAPLDADAQLTVSPEGASGGPPADEELPSKRPRDGDGEAALPPPRRGLWSRIPAAFSAMVFAFKAFTAAAPVPVTVFTPPAPRGPGGELWFFKGRPPGGSMYGEVKDIAENFPYSGEEWQDYDEDPQDFATTKIQLSNYSPDLTRVLSHRCGGGTTRRPTFTAVNVAAPLLGEPVLGDQDVRAADSGLTTASSAPRTVHLNALQLNCAAWLTDVAHSVAVTRRRRFVATYKIRRAGDHRAPTHPEMPNMERMLEDIFDSFDSTGRCATNLAQTVGNGSAAPHEGNQGDHGAVPCRGISVDPADSAALDAAPIGVAFLLHHQYSPAALRSSALKGVDAIAHAVAATRHECHLVPVVSWRQDMPDTPYRIRSEACRAVAALPQPSAVSGWSLGGDTYTNAPEFFALPQLRRLAWLELGFGSAIAGGECYGNADCDTDWWYETAALVVTRHPGRWLRQRWVVLAQQRSGNPKLRECLHHVVALHTIMSFL